MRLALMHSASCPCLLLIGLQAPPFPAVLSLSWGSPHAISGLAQQRRLQILHGVQLHLLAGIAKAQVMLSNALHSRQSIVGMVLSLPVRVCMLKLLCMTTQ